MKYRVRLFCDQTLTAFVEGPADMTEDQLREAALQLADAGEVDWEDEAGVVEYDPLPDEDPRCPHDGASLRWVDDQWYCPTCGDEFAADAGQTAREGDER